MVTVTGVRVTPDLREATVYVSVLGNEKKRRATLAGLESAHGVLQARIDRELRLRRTPHAHVLNTITSVERGVHMTKLIEESPRRPAGADRGGTATTRRLTSTRSSEALRGARPLPRRHAREPRRRRARLDARDDARAARARQGRVDVPDRHGAAAGRVRASCSSTGSARRCRTTSASACCSRSTARTSAASARPRPASSGAELVVNVDHHHDNTRFGDVNLIVADASSTAEIVRDMLRRARRRADARDRAGALRRARHRHGPLPVLEHDAEGAPARGRARRGRRRRARRLPARLRDGAVREAEAARARARARAAVRGRAARRLVPRCGTTSPRSAPRSRTRRGSSTTSARSRARRWWR